MIGVKEVGAVFKICATIHELVQVCFNYKCTAKIKKSTYYRAKNTQDGIAFCEFNLATICGGCFHPSETGDIEIGRINS